jgi:hypothetical protein
MPTLTVIMFRGIEAPAHASPDSILNDATMFDRDGDAAVVSCVKAAAPSADRPSGRAGDAPRAPVRFLTSDRAFWRLDAVTNVE